MALAIDIADAVVNELASGTFSQLINVTHRVLPEYELAELKELQVTVVPAAVEISSGSRTLSQYDVRIDIGIQKKLPLTSETPGSNLDTEVAQLCGLVDEVAEFIKRRSLQDARYALWLRTANEPIYAADHLTERRLFTSVLTVTYRVMK